MTKIITKMFFEEDKVHLSFEAIPGTASKEELEVLRNKLTEAFSVLLGIEEAGTVGVLGLERITAPKETIEEPPATPKQTVKAKAVSATTTNTATAEPATATNIAPPTFQEPTLGFGRYKEMTASEVVQKYGKTGAEYLEKTILPPVIRNLARFPQNKEKIDAINRAIGA